MLANRIEIRRLASVIEILSSTGNRTRNPYREILRRDYPEPLIALLAFILGIWLWDHYFGKNQGYEPGTEEVALVKIDRDLRLADAMSADPSWLRWLAGAETPVEARKNALSALGSLAREKAISLPGIEAFAILKAVDAERPIPELLAELMQGQPISEVAETSQSLARHGGTWWHARWIESEEKSMRPVEHWLESYHQDGQTIRLRALASRSAVWMLGLTGLAFLPSALGTLLRGLRAKPRGYGGAWPLTLGLTMFLVATLAWIGFTMTLEIGISSLPNLHPLVAIFLDSAARLLPPLIAVGLLFRRPSHAIRVMGLNQPIAARHILALFSILMVIDQGLRIAFGANTSADPGGGLSMGDAGMWGLAFSVCSACVMAPVSEELLYRGILFRSCWNRLGVLPAAVLSSAVFAVLHFYDGYGLASVGAFGMACALLYAATGSLATTIALHMLYNASIKIPEWLIYHAPLG